jgi:hypothetical protein
MPSTVSRKRGRRRRVSAGHTNDPEEIARLKAEVHCATVLERATPPWQLDRRASTAAALKYRRGTGEILIVNHGGRGWWDPTHPAAKGDVFDLVQHLEPGLCFGAVRQRLRALAGIVPSCTSELHRRARQPPRLPVAERWAMAPVLTVGSSVWHYLTETRGLPGRILHLATRHDLIREGPKGSAWFAHRDQEGRLAGIEMRGPRWRGMAAGSDKTLFRLPGGSLSAPRLVVVEAPIDALSLAALEGPRADTLYLATAGGIGPGTLQALRTLVASRAMDPAAELIAASDADPPGDRHATCLTELAATAGMRAARLRPPPAAGDWNELLVRARVRAAKLVS